MKILETILPRKIKSPLFRLGNPHDGGYVVDVEALHRVDSLYTYGVGGNTTFELDFYEKTKKPVYMFDHTVNDPKIENLNFRKEGLAAFCNKNFNNFISCNLHHHVLLKIDVEGAEVDWIKAMDFSKIAVDTMIIEFHNLLSDLPLIEKIKEHYNIIWIHPNNSGGMTAGFPNVLEVTFVAKKLDIFEGWARCKYPLKIDSPNIPNKPDYILDFRPIYL
jgi:hypothetical protein